MMINQSSLTKAMIQASTKHNNNNNNNSNKTDERDEILCQEFYPELLAVCLNFLQKYREALLGGAGARAAWDSFADLGSQALFHLSREATLQLVLEDAGLYADRDALSLGDSYDFLVSVLTELYWEQINQCLPPQFSHKSITCSNTFREDDLSNFNMTVSSCNNNNNNNNNSQIITTTIEDHPNLFNDRVAMYSYLPNILLNNLWAQQSSTLKRKVLKFEGACMIADISGFTKLSGKCCEEGTSGLDRLHGACSGYLGKFIQTVYLYQGDVISFAGDAIIVIFPLEYNLNDKNIEKSNCCLRAVECGKRLTQFFTTELTAHVGISYGEMSIAILGGYHDQWIYLMNGACINELSSCIDDALSKQVCVTSTLFDNLFLNNNKNYNIKKSFSNKLNDNCFNYEIPLDEFDDTKKVIITVTKLIESNNYRIDDFISTVKGDISESPFVKIRSRFEKFSTPDLYVRMTSNTSMMQRSHTQLLFNNFDGNVKLLVPKPIQDSITLATLETISQLREVTTIFMKLDSYDPIKNRDPQSLQDFCYMVQEKLYQTGGFLRQFLIDDKGCVLIAMWGVPSFSYSNNCSRAVAFSILLHTGAIKLGHKCSIGITIGTVYVGNIGSLIRRDFVGLGADVNLAARYMSKAYGKIFISEQVSISLPLEIRKTLIKSEGLILKGINGLCYAYICNEDINDNTIKNFIDKIDTVDEHINNIQNMKLTPILLLPKHIIDPIKSKFRKALRHQEFLSKQLNSSMICLNNSSTLMDEMTFESKEYSVPLQILAAVETFNDKKRSAPMHRWRNKMTPEQACVARTNCEHKPYPIEFIIADGPSGTGKTMLLDFVKEFAHKCTATVVSYACIQSDINVPLGVINKLALMMIGVDKQQERLEFLAKRMYWDKKIFNNGIHSIYSLQHKVILLKSALGLEVNKNRLRQSVLTNCKNFDISHINDNTYVHDNTYGHDDEELNLSKTKSQSNLTESKYNFSASVNSARETVCLLYSETDNNTNIDSKKLLTSNISNSVSNLFNNNNNNNNSNNNNNNNKGIKVLPIDTMHNSLSTSKDVQDEFDEELPEHTDNEGILFHLLFVLLNEEFYSLVIDDAHYCDESSWNIFYMLSNMLANSIIVLTLRSVQINQFNSLKEEKTITTDGQCTTSNNHITSNNSSSNNILPLYSPNHHNGNNINNVSTATISTSNSHDIAASPTSSNASYNVNYINNANNLNNFNGSNGSMYFNNNNNNNNIVYDRTTQHRHSISKGVSAISRGVTTGSKPISFTLVDLRGRSPEGCIRLRQKPHTIQLELKPFTKNEVREYLCKVLHSSILIQSLTDELVNLIFEISTGCPFWCKEIALFINSRGEDLFLSTTIGNNFDENKNDYKNENKNIKHKNPLHELIICRLESMKVEEQTIIKQASIIGEEFNAAVLAEIIPLTMRQGLSESIKELIHCGLLISADQDSDSYSFGNRLIHQIIYDLTPPSEANKVHRLIARTLEELYLENTKKSLNTGDLATLYNLLICHFSHDIASRANTFKYLVLQCDEYVYSQCYCDAILYAERAYQLAVSRTELRMLLTVLDCIIEKIAQKCAVNVYFENRIDEKDMTQIQIETLIKNINLKITAIGISRNKSGLDTENSMSHTRDRSVNLSVGGISITRDKSRVLNWSVSHSVSNNIGSNEIKLSNHEEIKKKSWNLFSCSIS